MELSDSDINQEREGARVSETDDNVRRLDLDRVTARQLLMVQSLHSHAGFDRAAQIYKSGQK